MVTSIVFDQEGQKVTPNQLAKEVIANKLSQVAYVLEGYDGVEDGMTDREREAFQEALQKRCDALLKYLSVDEFGHKV